jgi:hypothetical protein
MIAVIGIAIMAVVMAAATFLSWRECQPVSISVPHQYARPDVSAEDLHDRRRRRAARLWNERLKTMATFLNGLGIAVFVAVAITLPGPDAISSVNAVLGLSGAVGLHMLAQLALSRWKSEE